MWRCLKCGGEVADSVDNCWVCGTPRDGSGQSGLPSPAEPPILASVVHEAARRRPPGPQVGIPRRFGVGTMMILVTVFAVLFAIMKTFDTEPIVFGAIAVFFAGVGLCQILLFKGKDPRKASILGGIIMYGLFTLVAAIAVGVTGRNLFAALGTLVLGGMMSVIFGGPLGYLAGCLLAAVFLVRKEPDDPPPPDDPAKTDGPGNPSHEP